MNNKNLERFYFGFNLILYIWTYSTWSKSNTENSFLIVLPKIII